MTPQFPPHVKLCFHIMPHQRREDLGAIEHRGLIYGCHNRPDRHISPDFLLFFWRASSAPILFSRRSLSASPRIIPAPSPGSSLPLRGATRSGLLEHAHAPRPEGS